MQSVYDHLTSELRQKFEVPPENMSPDATLGALELDSLALVELFTVLQERWGVRLEENDENAGRLSLKEVTELVEEQMGEHTGEQRPAPHHGTES